MQFIDHWKVFLLCFEPFSFLFLYIWIITNLKNINIILNNDFLFHQIVYM